jgi:hypothetical protein
MGQHCILRKYTHSETLGRKRGRTETRERAEENLWAIL